MTNNFILFEENRDLVEAVVIMKLIAHKCNYQR